MWHACSTFTMFLSLYVLICHDCLVCSGWRRSLLLILCFHLVNLMNLGWFNYLHFSGFAMSTFLYTMLTFFYLYHSKIKMVIKIGRIERKCCRAETRWDILYKCDWAWFEIWGSWINVLLQWGDVCMCKTSQTWIRDTDRHLYGIKNNAYSRLHSFKRKEGCKGKLRTALYIRVKDNYFQIDLRANIKINIKSEDEKLWMGISRLH